MKKRALATVLWFNAAWFVGAFVAFATGTSMILAPILATAAAAIVATDPRHLLWIRTPLASAPASSSRGAPTPA